MAIDPRVLAPLCLDLEPGNGRNRKALWRSTIGHKFAENKQSKAELWPDDAGDTDDGELGLGFPKSQNRNHLTH